MKESTYTFIQTLRDSTIHTRAGHFNWRYIRRSQKSHFQVIVFCCKFVDVLNAFIGCQIYLGKSTIFIT